MEALSLILSTDSSASSSSATVAVSSGNNTTTIIQQQLDILRSLLILLAGRLQRSSSLLLQEKGRSNPPLGERVERVAHNISCLSSVCKSFARRRRHDLLPLLKPIAESFTDLLSQLTYHKHMNGQEAFSECIVQRIIVFFHLLLLLLHSQSLPYFTAALPVLIQHHCPSLSAAEQIVQLFNQLMVEMATTSEDASLFRPLLEVSLLPLLDKLRYVGSISSSPSSSSSPLQEMSSSSTLLPAQFEADFLSTVKLYTSLLQHLFASGDFANVLFTPLNASRAQDVLALLLTMIQPSKVVSKETWLAVLRSVLSLAAEIGRHWNEAEEGANDLRGELTRWLLIDHMMPFLLRICGDGASLSCRDPQAALVIGDIATYLWTLCERKGFEALSSYLQSPSGPLASAGWSRTSTEALTRIITSKPANLSRFKEQFKSSLIDTQSSVS